MAKSGLVSSVTTAAVRVDASDEAHERRAVAVDAHDDGVVPGDALGAACVDQHAHGVRLDGRLDHVGAARGEGRQATGECGILREPEQRAVVGVVGELLLLTRQLDRLLLVDLLQALRLVTRVGKAAAPLPEVAEWAGDALDGSRERHCRVGDGALRPVQRSVVHFAVPRREQAEGRGDEKAEEDTATDDAVDRHQRRTPGAGDLGRARRPMAGGTVAPLYPRRPCEARLWIPVLRTGFKSGGASGGLESSRGLVIGRSESWWVIGVARQPDLRRPCACSGEVGRGRRP